MIYTKREDLIISIENLSFLLAAMVIFGFICGVISGFFLNKFQYELKIDNAELIPYETLMKKGLAKPVKDENGDLKLKLMECE